MTVVCLFMINECNMVSLALIFHSQQQSCSLLHHGTRPAQVRVKMSQLLTWYACAAVRVWCRMEVIELTQLWLLNCQDSKFCHQLQHKWVR